MPLPEGTTVGQARTILANFLQSTECSEICARCPIYLGGEGCCQGCQNLTRTPEGEVLGCQTPNLSCLSYTCGNLNEHLRRTPSAKHDNALAEYTELIYGMPREGYRGCTRRADGEVLEITDPLVEIRAVVKGRRQGRHSM